MPRHFSSLRMATKSIMGVTEWLNQQLESYDVRSTLLHLSLLMESWWLIWKAHYILRIHAMENRLYSHSPCSIILATKWIPKQYHYLKMHSKLTAQYCNLMWMAWHSNQWATEYLQKQQTKLFEQLLFHSIICTFCCSHSTWWGVLTGVCINCTHTTAVPCAELQVQKCGSECAAVHWLSFFNIRSLAHHPEAAIQTSTSINYNYTCFLPVSQEKWGVL